MKNIGGMKNLGESGEGRLKFIFWMLILGVVGLAGYEAIPARIRIARYEDELIKIAESAWRVPESKLRQRVLDRASELDLPVAKDDIDLDLASGRIRIHVEYTLVLELPFYTWEWERTHDVDRPVFRW